MEEKSFEVLEMLLEVFYFHFVQRWNAFVKFLVIIETELSRNCSKAIQQLSR